MPFWPEYAMSSGVSECIPLLIASSLKFGMHSLMRRASMAIARNRTVYDRDNQELSTGGGRSLGKNHVDGNFPLELSPQW